MSVIIILASTIFWCLLYTLLKLELTSPEYSNRLITLVHGALMAVIGVKGCLAEGWRFDAFIECSDFQTCILLFSLGYFIFDLMWCIYYQSEGTVMLVHHMYTCFALFRVCQNESMCSQAICALGGMELTNPLLQIRWFLRTHGFSKSSWIYSLVEILFCGVFVFVRIIVGTVVGFNIVCSKETTYEFKFLAVVIYVVSWLFFIGICRLFYRKFVYPQYEILEQSDTVIVP